MFSPFTAEADFTFSSGERSVTGKARLTKADLLQLDILSPEPYCGISVESDPSGDASTYSLSYSGVRAEIPKTILEKLSLAFSLFSPDIPVKLRSLGKSDVAKCEEAYTSDFLSELMPYEAAFSQGQVNYSFVYDKATGIPLVMNVWHADSSATLVITKFKAQPDE